MSTKPMHSSSKPDPWVMRWLEQMSAGSTVLDFACGSGRHSHAAQALGLTVTAADRNAQALAGISPGIETLAVDLEAGAWPLVGRQFDAIVVTNYLFRPRLALLMHALAPGGRLIYSTFANGNARFGRPRNPDFLLQTGELLWRAQAGGLSVLAYEHGVIGSPPRAVVQRICAVRGGADAEWPGGLLA